MNRTLSAGGIPGFRGTRGDVVLYLKRHQPCTVNDLAERLGVTANGLRRHLKELEADGLVAFQREVRGVGGPVFVYRLTTAGDRFFPTSYERALSETLVLVREQFGPEAVIEIFRQRWHKLLAADKESLLSLPLRERTQRLAELLTGLGYMAEASDGGSATLREHNCTIRAIVEQFPEICTAEEQFLQEILGADVTRQTHIARGASCCEYCIAGADAVSSTSPTSAIASAEKA